MSHLWIILAQVPKNILLSFFSDVFNMKKYAEIKYIMGLDETRGREEIES